MEKQGRHYHFNGDTEEIVNSILSLLLSKEHYQEISIYSSFLAESHTERYKKRIRIILELMQSENLILIRENDDDNKFVIPVSNDKVNGADGTHSATARVYLRQHGKEVLSAGGYKHNPYKKINDTPVLK